MLTRAQADRDDEHGFVVGEGLLDSETLDGLKRVTDGPGDRGNAAVGCLPNLVLT